MHLANNATVCIVWTSSEWIPQPMSFSAVSTPCLDKCSAGTFNQMGDLHKSCGGLLSNCSIWRAKFGHVWNWVFFLNISTSFQSANFFRQLFCFHMWGNERMSETNKNFSFCIVMRFFRIIIIWFNPYCGLCITPVNKSKMMGKGTFETPS